MWNWPTANPSLYHCLGGRGTSSSSLAAERSRQFHSTGRGTAEGSSAPPQTVVERGVGRERAATSSKEGLDGTWAATLRELRDGRGMEQPLTSEVRQGKLVWRLGEARLEVMAALVQGQVILLMIKVMKVKGLVTVKVLLEVNVLVKVFVVEEVFLSSLSSTPFPRTRPAARVWASGAKGSGFLIVLPAPGRRCAGPFS